MSDNVEFFNKYVSVLKNKYNNIMSDMLQLETHNLLLNEALEAGAQENAALKEEIDRLNATISSDSTKAKKTTIKSVETEE